MERKHRENDSVLALNIVRNPIVFRLISAQNVVRVLNILYAYNYLPTLPLTLCPFGMTKFDYSSQTFLSITSKFCLIVRTKFASVNVSQYINFIRVIFGVRLA